MTHSVRLIAFFLLTFCSRAFCQQSQASKSVIVSGKVTDSVGGFVLPGVTVRSAGGEGVQSDLHGKYYLHAGPGDTLTFSYVGYREIKIVVPEGSEFYSENILLTEKDFSLPELKVKGYKNHRQDSLANRAFNAAIFNQQSRSTGDKLLGSVLSPFGVQFGPARRNRNALSRFKAKLTEDEHEKYIDSRFTAETVKSVTGLEGALLEDFMKTYRPSYDHLLHATEYELLELIIASSKQYLAIDSK